MKLIELLNKIKIKKKKLIKLDPNLKKNPQILFKFENQVRMDQI